MKTALALITAMALAALAPAQQYSMGSGSPDAAPESGAPVAIRPVRFDVISVKPANGTPMGSVMRLRPDGFSAQNVPLHMMLTEAFQTDEGQVLGEPPWSRTQLWDVEAKVVGEDVAVLKAMSFAQRQTMLRQVLEERFGLKVHHESRDLPVYSMVIAKGGPKLTEAKPDPNNPIPADSPGSLMFHGRKLEARSANLRFLGVVLARPAGRKIIDHTGLTGRYDFTLTWGSDANSVLARPAGAAGDGEQASGGPTSASSPDPNAGESLFTALEEQLGLKLEPTKAPLDVVVIDHVEKPADN